MAMEDFNCIWLFNYKFTHYWGIIFCIWWYYGLNLFLIRIIYTHKEYYTSYVPLILTHSPFPLKELESCVIIIIVSIIIIIESYFINMDMRQSDLIISLSVISFVCFSFVLSREVHKEMILLILIIRLVSFVVLN